MDIRSIVGTLLTSALVLGITSSSILEIPRVAASPARPHFDSDGDMLPDTLEWVLLTDPMKKDTDGDGRDDFLEAVQHILQLGPRYQRPMDHEMRVLVTTSANYIGGEDVWLTMLFRFVGAKVSDLTYFEPFVDHLGLQYPLSNLIGPQGAFYRVETHPTEGLYIIFSAKLTTSRDLRGFLPCTLAARAVINGKMITSGAYLMDTGGQTTTLVPVSKDEFVIQTLSPEDDAPFWSADRACVFKLSVIAKTPSGSFCEVNKADCIPKGKLACPPTCKGEVGKVTFFPDGIATVTGG